MRDMGSTRGNQAFNVPNDSEGQEFLRLLKKFRNKGKVKYQVRGRGPRYDYAQARCRHENARWFAVYLEQETESPPPKNQPASRTVPFNLTQLAVEEWSAPLEQGDIVAITSSGKVYNPSVHGLLDTTSLIGRVFGDIEGSIGEGTGTVWVNLRNDPEDVPSDVCGCDFEAGFMCPQHNST